MTEATQIDSAVETTKEIVQDAAQAVQATPSPEAAAVDTAYELTSATINLMGGSFILGVLCMTFLLLVLDFMRRNKNNDE